MFASRKWVGYKLGGVAKDEYIWFYRDAQCGYVVVETLRGLVSRDVFYKFADIVEVLAKGKCKMD